MKILPLFLPLAALSQSPENWAQKPMEEWPQIALVNDVMYQNGDRYEDPTITYAGTGFLLDTGAEILAITVKHVLWVARNKSTRFVEVNSQLGRWKMYPKGNPADSAVIGRLVNEDPSEPLWDGWDNGVLQRDWLVFTTRSVSPNLYPLKLSKKAVEVGDKILMTGNPYRFDQTLKARGEVLQKEGDIFFVKLDGLGKAFLGGASGSPVFDDEGQLVGIFSNSRQDEKTGENLYIIHSTHYLKKVLAGKKPLNVNKKPVSVFLDSLILQEKMKKALKKFDTFLADEKTAFQYGVTYPNHGALIRSGENLMTQNRVKDAVLYFEYFFRKYPNLLYIKPLAQAYIRQGKKEKALKMVKAKMEVEKEDEVKVELEKFLAEISG